MKKQLLLLVLTIILMNNVQTRRHKADADPVKDATATAAAGASPDATTMCSIEEMQIRIRGTFVIGQADAQDRIGQMDVGANPDATEEDTAAAADAKAPAAADAKAPAAAADAKAPAADAKAAPAAAAKAAKRLVAAELDEASKATKAASDKTILEIQALLNPDDLRPLNMFNIIKMELPSVCQAKLKQGELAVLSDRSTNYTYCWLNASEAKDTTTLTYLNLPYLQPEQFAVFYACAEKLSDLKKSEAEYVSPVVALTNFQALFNVVQGKHIPGTPINWLKFWVFVCMENNMDEQSVWKTVEGQSDFIDTLTPEYTDKMKKLTDNAIALDTLRKKVKGNSAVMSTNRFARKNRRQRHQYKWTTHKSSLKALFRLANHKIQAEVVKMRRLKKHLKRHH